MASSKNYTEVLIGGKVFTLSGFESEDYLQKVSTYLNHKIEECSSSEGYRKQSAETRSVLLALNIADDYFKARKQGMLFKYLSCFRTDTFFFSGSGAICLSFVPLYCHTALKAPIAPTAAPIKRKP